MTINNRNMAAFLPKLIEDIENMADKLYKGQENDALFMLYEIIDGIESVMIEYANVANSPANILKLNEILPSVNSIIASKNYIQLADIFKYEVIAVLTDILDESVNKSNN